MAEVNETPDNNNPAPEQKEYSPVEQKAMEQGWVPQEEWAGDPDDWRPAKEYVDRGELLKSISSLKRDNLQLKQAFEEFGKHHAQVQQIAYKKAIDDLKAQRREALREGDVDAVDQIEERIEQVKEAADKTKAPTIQAAPEPHPAFVAWEQRNDWYKRDRAMKNTADDIARELVQNGERDPVRILTEIDKQIRKEFPQKFNNPNRDRAGSVEGSTNKGGRAKDDVLEAMSDDERRIMKRIIATGAITKEKYLEEFKARKSA